jgi:hypothetical protein
MYAWVKEATGCGPRAITGVGALPSLGVVSANSCFVGSFSFGVCVGVGGGLKAYEMYEDAC